MKSVIICRIDLLGLYVYKKDLLRASTIWLTFYNRSSNMIMDQFKGRVIAITGAASGIGQAIAKQLSKRGAILSMADKNEKGLQETLKQLEGEGHMCTGVDVRNSEQVDGWINTAVKKLGRLDGAVNFAGVGHPVRLVDQTNEQWDFVMDINAKGVFYCLRAQLRKMKAGASIVSLPLAPMLASGVPDSYGHHDQASSNPAFLCRWSPAASMGKSAGPPCPPTVQASTPSSASADQQRKSIQTFASTASHQVSNPPPSSSRKR